MKRPRKRTQARAANAATGDVQPGPRDDVLPLHVMLAAMRRAWAQAETAERLAVGLADDAGREVAEREAAAARKLAQAWAKDCAPYLHARLSTTAADAPEALAYVILGVTEEGSEEQWTKRHAHHAGSKPRTAPGPGPTTDG